MILTWRLWIFQQKNEFFFFFLSLTDNIVIVWFFFFGQFEVFIALREFYCSWKYFDILFPNYFYFTYFAVV